MCLYLKIDSSVKEITDRFKVPFTQRDYYEPTSIVYAGDFPEIPVIRNHSVELLNWGLIPSTAKNSAQTRFFRINNQNARIESVHQTASFREITEKRCLIITNGFYTRNNKVLFKSPNRDLITLAGLWDEWINLDNGSKINSFTLLTTEASSNMQENYNGAARMPVILAPWEESEWLRGAEMETFMDRSNIDIRAIEWIKEM